MADKSSGRDACRMITGYCCDCSSSLLDDIVIIALVVRKEVIVVVDVERL